MANEGYFNEQDFIGEQTPIDEQNFVDEDSSDLDEYSYSEDEDSVYEGEEQYDSSSDSEYYEEEQPEILSQSSSTHLEEDDVTANAIIDSLQNVLPELQVEQKLTSELTAAPVRMTDLSFKITQLVMNKKGHTSPLTSNNQLFEPIISPSPNEGDYQNEEEYDPYLEKTLSGRRKNKTGVRGRPKKVDYGFGKSTTHVLPPEIAKLMGQANMAYVTRKYDEATSLLLEVVRQAPHAFEAYQTLAIIHEELHHLDKALSYYVIAAHLIKNDTDLWRKLAKLTLQLGRNSEAIYYLSKLINMKESRAEYFWTRARVYVEREDHRKAVVGFYRLLLMEVGGDGSMFYFVNTLADRLDLGYMTSQLFTSVIQQSINHHRIPSLSVIIYILELLLERKEFDKIEGLFEIFSIPLVNNLSNLPVDWFLLDQSERLRVATFDLLPIELKLISLISRINLKKASNSDLNSLLHSTEIDLFKHGQLIRRLGQALLTNAQPSEALNFLIPLMNIPSQGDTDLGLMIGECYRLIPGQEDMAISTFEAILQVNPNRGDARTALCDLYRQRGQMDKASQIMKDSKDKEILWPAVENINRSSSPITAPDYSTSTVFEGLFSWDPTLGEEDGRDGEGSRILNFKESVIRKRKTGKRKKRIRRYIPYSSAQIQAVQQDYQRIQSLFASGDTSNFRQLRLLAKPLIDDMLENPSLRPGEKSHHPKTVDISLLHGLNIDEWFNLLCKYLVVESKVGSLEKALRLTRIFLSKRIFYLNSVSSIILRLFQIGLSGLLGKPTMTLHSVRWLLRTWPDLPISMSVVMHAIWNCSPDEIDPPFIRFLDRQMIKHPESQQVYLISLCAHLYTERFDGAIRAGYHSLSLNENHPITLICTAVALLQQSTKRTCKNPSALQVRAFSILLRYEKVLADYNMGDEAAYNLGRAFHMMGIRDLASKYYRQALNGRFRCEAAFNLHLLLLLDNRFEAAAYFLNNYIPPIE